MEVWVDFRQIHAGEMWEKEIYRGLERSQIVVLCLSPDAVASEWVQREVTIAREQEKFILPVMAVDAIDDLQRTENMRWLLQVQYIDFEADYESAFPDLLRALPGKRRIGPYDSVNAADIPNPFKGLEAFQQTDAAFFFGRETLIDKSLERLKADRDVRFLAIVGGSGTGKSSLVRAGVLPAIRDGRLPHSESWRLALLTPGDRPISALANRLSPLIENMTAADVDALLRQNPRAFNDLVENILRDTPPEVHIVLVVDQFEEVFTRASDTEAENFLRIIQHAVTYPDGRAHVLITMRSDFFDRLSRYPGLAELFEQENMVIVTEMTPDELLRTIEGPAQAVGMTYDRGLPQRILEEVRRQPGSLPLLQYALKELFQRREGLRLTTRAYDEIGGVRQALAGHAEVIYQSFGSAQQSIMRRVLLRLVEISESGEATRRRVAYDELRLRDVPAEVVDELLERLTASDTRLLTASRQITSRGDESRPRTFYEVGHEALIREWDRFREWVNQDLEDLRLGSEILQAATDWQASDHDTAYLLTGNRLARAEIWLNEADTTPLQREFMQASIAENERQEALDRSRMERELTLQRKAATRLRFAVAVLIAGFLAVGVLAGLAIIAQQEARDAEQRAVFNLRRAVSLSLSASANRELDAFQSDQAAKLAVNAALVDLDAADLPELSERILADVVYRPGARHHISTDGVAAQALAISASGERAFVGWGSSLVVWDMVEGVEIERWTGTEAWRHAAEITAISYNHTRGLVASADGDGLIVLWDATEGVPVAAWRDHSARVNGLSFDAPGDWLVSGGVDQIVIARPLDGERDPLTLRDHNAIINDVAINASATAIASAGQDQRVSVWRVEAGRVTRQYFLTGLDDEAEAAPMTRVGFLDGSNLLAGGDENGLVILWNFSLNRVIDRLNSHQVAVSGIVYDPPSNTLFTADAEGLILRWRISPPRRVVYGFRDHRAAVTGLSLSSAGGVLASTDLDANLRVWDVQNAADAGTLSVLNGRDLRGVYGADDRTIFTTTVNGAAFLWDAASGLIIQNFDQAEGQSNGRITAMAINPDGRTALTAHGDRRIVLWDTVSGAARLVVPDAPRLHDSQTITAAAFFPDGGRFATADTRGLIVIWSNDSGAALLQLNPSEDKDAPGHESTVNALAVHPSGDFLLSASADGTLILWDTNTGQPLITYEGHNNRPVTSVAFDATGNYALSGANDGRVILWNTSAGLETRDARRALLRRFDVHNASVNGVAFSPVRAQFATISADDTLVVWDIRNSLTTGTTEAPASFSADAAAFDMRLFEISASENFINLQFSRDGRTIITGLNNGQLRRWRAFPFADDLLGFMAQYRMVEPLSASELELFRVEDDLTPPEVYPYPIPTPTAEPQWNVVQIGGQAMINATDGLRVNVRRVPGDNAPVEFQLERGAVVTVLDGPQAATGLNWWLIRAEDGAEGWVAGSVNEPRPVQILVPGLLAEDD